MSQSVFSPFDVADLSNNSETQQMYPYYFSFHDKERSSEESYFWFQENVHHPRPLKPFETIVPEAIKIALGQVNTRLFGHPFANGIEQRIINGYVYFGAVPKNPGAASEEEIKAFQRKSDHYYSNWNSFYSQWQKKVSALTAELKALQFAPLPESEDEKEILSASGYSSGLTLLKQYQTLIASLYQIWQYHFEMLNIGYAALLDFYLHCRSLFPSINDSAISKMLHQGDLLLFRPQQEIGKLVEKMTELKLDLDFAASENLDDFFVRIAGKDEGCRWLDHYEQIKAEWFDYSTGSGFYADDPVWADDEDVIYHLLKNAHSKDRESVSLHRDAAKIADDYSDLLESSEEKQTFRNLLEKAKTVSAYLEDHNFYVEHRYMSNFWRKIKQIGDMFVSKGYVKSSADILYFNHWEIGQFLYDMCAGWATRSGHSHLTYLCDRVKLRKEAFAAFQEWTPPAFLGTIPREIHDPILITLFGINHEKIDRITRKESGAASQLRGLSASPGIVSAETFLVTSYEDFKHMPEGVIIVCDCVLPSWAHHLVKAVGVISENGGVLSHAAITCREFGIPAVVNATKALTTLTEGQRVQLDGTRGVITIL